MLNWYFFKLCPSKAKAGFKKITKLVKSGFLMIIHIYAKASWFFKYKKPTKIKFQWVFQLYAIFL
ncbi:hypothetical protein BHECKSOX2_308 [Bathymodiolus heckerae thiotrophic gill symbiont]|nr:hypothetical protein BHECKSOX2_308 [Bathymodiolus heckerae thiotrophic gill symbiont]